jgi:hypothetical protein
MCLITDGALEQNAQSLAKWQSKHHVRLQLYTQQDVEHL